MSVRNPRRHLEIELAKLEALPEPLAARHLAWRLVEAFVARDAKRLLFWCVAFAMYQGKDSAVIVDEVLSVALPNRN